MKLSTVELTLLINLLERHKSYKKTASEELIKFYEDLIIELKNERNRLDHLNSINKGEIK